MKNDRDYRISVIIPHYNCPDKLERLLKTIPDRKELQVIVVDDRSDWKKDEWSKLIEKYRKENFLFLSNEEGKKGAGTCRNIGLSKAGGEWLLFADSDDYFSDDFWEVVSPFLDSDCDIVYFAPFSVEEDSGEMSDRHQTYQNMICRYQETNGSEEALRALRYNWNSPCSKMIKRQLAAEHDILFDEVRAANDVMFSAKCGYWSRNIGIGEGVFYYITKSTGTLTTSLKEDIFDARLDVFIRKYGFLKSVLPPKELRKLRMNGADRLFFAFLNHYGLKKVWKVFMILKKNHVPIISGRLFNPAYLFKTVCKVKAKRKKDQRFYKNR